MKKLLIFLFAVLIINIANAQWKQTSGPYSGEPGLYQSGSDIFAITGSGIYLSTNNGSNWIAKNTGLNDSTQVWFLATDKNKIFAGTPGGIYRTNNNGDNWTAVNNGLTKTKVIAMTIKEDTLYARIYSGGIFASSDSGSNWSAVDTDTNFNVYGLAVSGNNIFARTSSGVFLSKDNCVSWTEKDNGIPFPEITTLAISGDTLFAGNAEDGGYWSTDTGNNWTRFIAVNSPEMTSYSINGNNILACTADWLNEKGGLYLTTNGGNNWSTLYTGSTVSNAITVENNIFAGTMNEGVLMSTDNGKSWKGANAGLPYNAQVTVLAESGSNIYAGTTNGIYITSDSGKIWTASGLSQDTISALACNGNNLFAAFGGKCCNQVGGWSGFSNYVYLSQNSGATWAKTKGVIINVLSLATSGNNLFAVAAGGIQLSTNSGDSWTSVNSGLPSNTNIYTLAISGNNIFTGTGNGVYLSSTNGENWIEVNNGIPANTDIYTLAMYGNKIYAGANNSVYLSSDTGANWIEINNESPAKSMIYALAVAENKVFAGTDDGVYLNSNDGSGWVSINNGLTVTPIKSLAINGTIIYAGTDATGVWKTSLSEIVGINNSAINNMSCNVFPNPGKSTFTIELPQSINECNLTIFDINGHELLKRKINDSKTQVELNNLSSGVYFVKLINGNSVVVKKIIKE